MIFARETLEKSVPLGNQKRRRPLACSTEPFSQEASRKESDEAHGEEVGHHGTTALDGVGLLGALLGQDGGILGVDSAAMDFVAQQDAGEPGLQLALQPTVRKTADPREGTYAQCLAPTPHVLAPMFLQGDAPLIHPLFPNARKCATRFHVGVPF